MWCAKRGVSGGRGTEESGMGGGRMAKESRGVEDDVRSPVITSERHEYKPGLTTRRQEVEWAIHHGTE